MAKMVMSLIRPRFNYDSLLLKKSHPPSTAAPQKERERAWEFCSKPLHVHTPSLTHIYTHTAQKKERKTTPPPLCFLSAVQ